MKIPGFMKAHKLIFADENDKRDESFFARVNTSANDKRMLCYTGAKLEQSVELPKPEIKVKWLRAREGVRSKT